MATLRGPLFDGRAERAAQRLCDALEEDIAQRGVHMVLDALHEVLKHPTGRYESRVRAEPYGFGQRVGDSGMVYGPWLEGTGSRNKTTRFKGYSTFRKVRDQLDREALHGEDGLVTRYVHEMGGRA